MNSRIKTSRILPDLQYAHKKMEWIITIGTCGQSLLQQYFYLMQLNLIIQLCTVKPKRYFTKNIFSHWRFLLSGMRKPAPCGSSHTFSIVTHTAIICIHKLSFGLSIEPTSVRPIFKSSAIRWDLPTLALISLTLSLRVNSVRLRGHYYYYISLL